MCLENHIYYLTAQKYRSTAFVHSVYVVGYSEKISGACNVYMNFVITHHQYMLELVQWMSVVSYVDYICELRLNSRQP
jgi:hypothetical protein